jgi:hypothetical protein
LSNIHISGLPSLAISIGEALNREGEDPRSGDPYSRGMEERSTKGK